MLWIFVLFRPGVDLLGDWVLQYDLRGVCRAFVLGDFEASGCGVLGSRALGFKGADNSGHSSLQ